MLSARKAVSQMHEYHPPLAGRKGLRLDFNENTEGCSPRVLSRIREITAEELARYPEREPVERMVAGKLGLPADQVLLTNGVDEAIHLLCEAYLEPSDEVMVVTPTFGMYEIFAEATGAKVVRVQCGEDLQFPFEQVLRAITPATRLIAIASPNNPTGGVASREQMLAIAQRAPHAAVLVDEAYYEFHGKTVLSDVVRQENLFVARTFSKAYGLAGLRIGILAGPREQMPMVRRVSSPYSVNAVALAALPVALEDGGFVANYVEQVKAGRERLEQALTQVGNHMVAERGEFRADEDRRAAPRVRGRYATTWDIGARPIGRPGMRWLRAHHAWARRRRPIGCWRRCDEVVAELKLGAEVKA